MRRLDGEYKGLTAARQKSAIRVSVTYSDDKYWWSPMDEAFLTEFRGRYRCCVYCKGSRGRCLRDSDSGCTTYVHAVPRRFAIPQAWSEVHSRPEYKERGIQCHPSILFEHGLWPLHDGLSSAFILVPHLRSTRSVKSAGPMLLSSIIQG
jgi:hypothetical protein